MALPRKAHHVQCQGLNNRRRRLNMKDAMDLYSWNSSGSTWRERRGEMGGGDVSRERDGKLGFEKGLESLMESD
jgi:hypothetical protein